jgi:hypothetical protein
VAVGPAEEVLGAAEIEEAARSQRIDFECDGTETVDAEGQRGPRRAGIEARDDAPEPAPVTTVRGDEKVLRVVGIDGEIRQHGVAELGRKHKTVPARTAVQ